MYRAPSSSGTGFPRSANPAPRSSGLREVRGRHFDRPVSEVVSRLSGAWRSCGLEAGESRQRRREPRSLLLDTGVSGLYWAPLTVPPGSHRARTVGVLVGDGASVLRQDVHELDPSGRGSLTERPLAPVRRGTTWSTSSAPEARLAGHVRQAEAAARWPRPDGVETRGWCTRCEPAVGTATQNPRRALPSGVSGCLWKRSA